MEKIKSNGFPVDDAVVNFSKSSDAYYNSPVQYRKILNSKNESPDLEHSSMAPRIEHNLSNSAQDTSADSFLAIKITPSSMSYPSYPTKLESYEPLADFALSRPEPDHTVESVGQSLNGLSKRCQKAERDVLTILSQLNRISAKPESVHVQCTDDHLSEATESSSDEETNYQACPPIDGAWNLKRAILRSHWFLLESDMVRASDCLKNLKSIRNRSKKLRRSIPLLSQGGRPIDPESQETASRTLQYEKSHNPRHSYYNLSTISELNFSFPGGAPPRLLNSPHCLQTFTSGCICCCPSFNRQTLVKSVSSSDVTERSIAIDGPGGSRHADVSSSFQRARNNSPTSCSFAFSQDGCIDSHRHHHSPCFRSPPNKVQRQLNNCSNHRRQNLVDDFISLTASFPRKRTHSNAFQVPESPREIAVPRWCKMPYPLSWDNAQKPKGGNDSTPQGHFNTSSKTQSNFNYRISPLDASQLEDTSNEYYKRLHAIEEISEHRRKAGFVSSVNASSIRRPPDNIS